MSTFAKGKSLKNIFSVYFIGWYKSTFEKENDGKMMKMSTFVNTDEANLSPMSTLENINF